MNQWQRRFSLGHTYDLNRLSTPAIRIRTWSDSVAEVATAEEEADRDVDLSEALTRRLSFNLNANRSNGSDRATAHRSSVTDFLASHTLALFLKVPNSTQMLSANDELTDERSGPRPEAENAHRDSSHRQPQQPEQQDPKRSFKLRKLSDSTGSSSASSSAGLLNPWRRRFSERISGATLSASMASAAIAGSKALSPTTRLSVGASTSKLDEVTSNNNGLSSAAAVDEPTIPSSQSSNNSNYKKSSTAGLESSPSYRNLKKFSQSTPAIPQLHYDLNNLGRSKSRQKKFLRLFPHVSREERVLNHYSCALVGDILLQGHLYITYNYFAFHSNVFGYVTKLLIPMGDVSKISKEKTARIIPNAIGVTTQEGRKIFGSLMTRDVTFRLALSVWKKFHFPNGGDIIDCVDGERDNEGSSQNGEHSSNESYSHHSAEGLLINLSRPLGDGIHVTSATSDGTSSELDENDSAIERSYSPTPEREDDDLSRPPSFAALNQLSPALSKSRSIFNLFSSKLSTSEGDHDCLVRGSQTADEDDELEVSDFHPASSGETSSTPQWAYWSISLLLAIFCLSAGILWYRMYLLHSHLEHRLLSEGSAQPTKPAGHSLYSPQMQELVDNLHLLLSSRLSNEERK